MFVYDFNTCIMNTKRRLREMIMKRSIFCEAALLIFDTGGYSDEVTL